MELSRIAGLKRDVLLGQMVYLAGSIGNPERYRIDLRSAKITNREDWERINAKVTTKDKVELLIDLLCEKGRWGNAERTPFDVLVEIFEKSVHPHAAKKLLKALEKAIQEDESTQELKRLGDEEEVNESGDVKPTALPVDGVGMETASYEVQSRGAHTPRLKLHENEDTITTIEPQPFKQLPELDYYPMMGNRHGVAFIINNKEFDHLKRREGTDRDEANLIETWLYLGYHVEVRRNCNRDQIMKIFKGIDVILETLNQTAKDEKKVENDSFVCCFLTHGKRDGIFASDDKSVTTEEIEHELGKSKTLRSKPKLFFVQACRGKSPGVEIQSDDQRHMVSNRSDFCYTYATSAGDVSYRNTVKGTWFVSELCKVLCEFATCCTLHELQHRVNSVIPANPEFKITKFTCLDSTHTEVKEYTQQPSYAGSMTRCLHFFHQAMQLDDKGPKELRTSSKI